MKKHLKTVLAMAFALALIPGAAYAQQSQTVDYGVTSVQLSSELTGALKALDVAAGTVSPTKIVHGIARFPVVAGALDLKTLKGEIIHSGGLTLSAGKTVVVLQSFTIDTTGNVPLLTGIAVKDGVLLGRVPLFDLNLAHAKITVDDDWLRIGNVALTLNEGAANDLNSFFGVSAFHGGLPIGTAKVAAALSADDK